MLTIKDEIFPVAAYLFQNVTNAAEIRKFVFSSSLPCCMLKPKFILDDLQLGIVLKKAVDNRRDGTMRTRSLPTEIIYNLSPSRNISESLKTFGAADEDTEILFLYEGQDFNDKIKNVIKGDEVPMNKLNEFSDVNAITQVYDVSNTELSSSSLLDSVISRIASKEFS